MFEKVFKSCFVVHEDLGVMNSNETPPFDKDSVANSLTLTG